jgi:hypothetical protein
VTEIPSSEKALLAAAPSLVGSIKGEGKKKHFCAGWNFSGFSAH